ncbi:spidroin-1-like [Pyrgilauda ruficollis]|uniref:spidroin-1-like n=1 Tax=Pyrgilauda ruficollis TaxID=221976 RepID=UPI001B869248|nr:spidroin-1-like [Pyrgilauda ruficollis]
MEAAAGGSQVSGAAGAGAGRVGTGRGASGAGRDGGGAALTGRGAGGRAQITSRGRQPPPPLPTAGGRRQQRRPRQRSPHFLRRGAKGATRRPPLLIAATDRKWRHGAGGAPPPIRRSHHRDGRWRGGSRGRARGVGAWGRVPAHGPPRARAAGRGRVRAPAPPRARAAAEGSGVGAPAAVIVCARRRRRRRVCASLPFPGAQGCAGASTQCPAVREPSAALPHVCEPRPSDRVPSGVSARGPPRRAEPCRAAGGPGPSCRSTAEPSHRLPARPRLWLSADSPKERLALRFPRPDQGDRSPSH